LYRIADKGGTPHYTDEYENRRLVKFAIRNWLILRGLVFGGVKRDVVKRSPKKSGSKPRTPNGVIYSIKYSRN
jgi:hypothetical protein